MPADANEMADTHPLLQAELQADELITGMIEIETSLGKEGSAINTVLTTARNESAEALNSLMFVDPQDHKRIVELQSVAKRYASLCEWMKSILYIGQEAADERANRNELRRQNIADSEIEE